MMLKQQMIEQLHTLKLTGMLDALEQQRTQPATHDIAFEERLALLRYYTGRTAGWPVCSRLPSYGFIPVWKISTIVIHAAWKSLKWPHWPAVIGYINHSTCALPVPPAAAKPGWPVPWVIRPAAKDCRYAICACPISLSSCASPMVMALTLG